LHGAMFSLFQLFMNSILTVRDNKISWS